MKPCAYPFLPILAISLFLPNFLIGQSYRLQNYGTHKGLNSNRVYEINQDRKGYLWIGTANGLCRFDGKTFKKYHSPKLKDAEIIRTRRMLDGTIGFCNLSGQLGLIQGDSIFMFPDFDGFFQGIYDFQMDENGTYYLCTTKDSLHPTKGTNMGSICSVSADLSEVKEIYISQRYYKNLCWHPDEQVLLLRTDRAVHLFDRQELWALPQIYSKFAIQRVYPSTGGFRIVQRAMRRLMFLDLKTEQARFFTIKGLPEGISHFYDWLVDAQGMHWLATNLGVFQARKTAEFELEIVHSLKRLEGLDAYCLFLDREDNLWIGTAQNGLFLLPFKKNYNWNLEEWGLSNQFVELLTPNPAGGIMGITNRGYLLELTANEFHSQKILPKGDYKGVVLHPDGSKFIYGNQPFYEIDPQNKVHNYSNDSLFSRIGKNVKSCLSWKGQIYGGDPFSFFKLDREKKGFIRFSWDGP